MLCDVLCVVRSVGRMFDFPGAAVFEVLVSAFVYLSSVCMCVYE